MIVDCAIYKGGHRTEGPADFSDALEQARQDGDSFLWIGLHEPTQEEFDLVSGEFGLHPLAVEDALTAHQRPKLEVYQDSLFLALKPVTYDDDADVVSADELMVFVGDSFVVTVRHGEGQRLKEVRERLEDSPDVLAHGPCAVLYAVCDATVDHYVDVASELHTDLELLEEEIFAPDGGTETRNTAGRIYGFKRQVMEFRRATSPLADPMTRLALAQVPYVDRESQPFFRDVSDHLTRVNEQVDGLDRLLSDMLGAHLTQVGIRQNDDMRKISAWAAIAAVPTLIAGVYGMNFTHMPELQWHYGYYGVLGVMLAACWVLYVFFKKRGWL
ncbi:magnesium/cobalt transporter CorA [Streptomyces sp. SL13]|uniref:Magnesium transport protein CorA n=1 Tax=Streptantibioticus silvisoli TaxID=2705255 RepID=A0AA90HAG5_9ACTN|nr:magnesium/cobalt transporter CorA [Streptantibioticus silvisoli]MDI5967612.1 magnesium/cobalt transporter CorA [Streptantibioticus silvisoli]MDI5974296.1 magnesium/cobalt transporter CorA [Streptantibioticus silvisoli]